MIRKFAVALLGICLLAPSLANALGLGEITLNSSLSQPFDAEIELLQVRDLSLQEILPALASREDFEKAGVDRSFFLSSFRFRVVFKDDGSAVIKVTSNKPVREPFLNFLVEVHWPEGRLLREYTVLLDPPAFSQDPASSVSISVKEPEPAAPQQGTIQRETPVQLKEQSRQPAPAQQAAKPTPSYGQSTYQAPGTAAATGGEAYRTSRNESLWNVAVKMRPSRDVNVQQTMIAIQRANPDAFIDNNINLMRSGQVLRTPSVNEVRQVTRKEAIEEVSRQNRAWKARLANRSGSKAVEAPQISSTEVEQPAPAPASDSGSLKLVSAETAEGVESGTTSGQQGSSAGSARIGALENKLTVLEENLSKAELQNEDLKVKLTDLSDQVSTGEKLISLKDEQIASLQARLAELEEQNLRMAEAKAAAQTAEEGSEPEVLEGEAPAEVAETEAPAIVEPVVEGVAEGEVVAVDEAVEGETETVATGEVDYNFSDEAPAQDVSAPESAETAEEQVVQAPDAEPAPAPAPAPSAMDDLLSAPMMLGSIALIVVVIVGVIMVTRRGRASNDELVAELEDTFSVEDLKDEGGVGEGDDAPSVGDFSESAEGLEDLDAEPEADAAAEKDVLGEVDIYIAYGRMQQAVDFLNEAIEKDPVRPDYRLKLLEVYAELGDGANFARAEEELSALGDDAANQKAAELHARLRENAGDNTVETSVGELGGAEDDSTQIMGSLDEAATAEEEAGSLDFDLGEATEEEEIPSLDDLEDTLTGAEPVAEMDGDATVEVDALDFDASLGEEPVTDDLAEDSTESEDTGLEFELDMDGLDDDDDDTTVLTAPSELAPADNLSKLDVAEETIDPEAAASIASELDDGFDFDLGDSKAPAAEAETETDLGVDLDADLSIEEDSVELELDSGVDTDLDAELDAELELDEPLAETDDADLEFSLDDDVADLEADAETPSLEAEGLDEDIAGEELAGDDETVMMAPTESVEEEFSLDDDLDMDDLSVAEDVTADDSEAAAAAPALSLDGADLDDEELSGEEDLGFLSDADETATKLDLARAYIDMGDRDGAKDILEEVMLEGSDEQQAEAKNLLERVE